MKKVFIYIFFISSIPSYSQTIFTYGNKAVSKKEFLQSFHKNNNGDSSAKALQDYLQLYINYKLKVQAAYDEGLDKEPSVLNDASAFKKQMAENIINQQANINSLMQEAFERSKKEILLNQIFIEYGNDSIAAFKKTQAAYNLLKAGKPFKNVVQQFSSTDENGKQSNGQLGFITVFALPFEIENIVYALKPNQFSTIYKGKYGYHIFFNEKERPANATRKVTQIFFSYPPNATEQDKNRIIAKANMVFNLMKSETTFDSIAAKYSDETNPENAVFEVSTGKFDAAFEAKIFALQQAGNISQPIVSADGVRIVQLKEIAAIPKNFNEAVTLLNLKQKVESSDRVVFAKKKLLPKWMQQINYKKSIYNEAELWQYTDSFINNKTFKNFKNIKDSTIIFTTQKQKFYAIDFCLYVKTISQPNVALQKSYSSLLKDFTNQQCADYYRNHLEEYNAEMQTQAKDFAEANLLFAVMDKHVWGNAGKDSVALKKYYLQHTAQYVWQPSMAAIIVTASNKEMAIDAAKKIKEQPENWRSITTSYGASVNADSGRFENTQLPFAIPNPQTNSVTEPQKSTNDNSYTFLYITKIYTEKEQRNFNDAKGLLINDYQQVLEENWLQQLKKKYPIKINEAVWKTIHL